MPRRMIILVVLLFTAKFSSTNVWSQWSTDSVGKTSGIKAGSGGADEFANHTNKVVRAVVPPAKNVEKAMLEIKEFYAEELRESKSPESKINFATLLLNDAIATEGDEVGKYALLSWAQDIAIEAEDIDFAISLSKHFSDHFKIDSVQSKAAVIHRANDIKDSWTPDRRLRIYQEAIQLVDPLLDAGELRNALELCKIASRHAKAARNLPLYRSGRLMTGEIESFLDEEQVINDTAERANGSNKLADQTALASFKCFVLGDWSGGLPILNGCKDIRLSDLSKRSLTASGTKELLGVADDWWDISDELTGRKQRVTRKYAASLYEKVLPEVSGLHARRAQSRIEKAVLTISGEIGPKGVVGNLSDSHSNNILSGRDRRRRRDFSQEFTSSGNTKLEPQEMNTFIQQRKGAKQALIESIRKSLNSGFDKMTPEEVDQSKEMFEFVSNSNVIVVPRSRVLHGAPQIGHIFKPNGPYDEAYSARFPYCSAETIEIIDDHRALVQLAGRGPVILEGIDARSLPLGKWDCYYLLKRTSDTKVPGLIGDKEIVTFQAISLDGLPDGILLW